MPLHSHKLLVGVNNDCGYNEKRLLPLVGDTRLINVN
jgi:hypothetical protein